MKAHAWWMFGVGGVTAGVVSLALPLAVQTALPAVLSVAGALAMVAGIRWHRPNPATPWQVITAGMGVMAAGNLAVAAYRLATGETPYPLWFETFFLVGYLFLATGLLRILRAWTPGRDVAGLLDALVVAVSAGAIAWVFLVAPRTVKSDLPLSHILVALAFPLCDLVLLTVSLRVVLAGGLRNVSIRLILLGVGLVLTADTVYTLGQVTGSTAYDDLAQAGWLLAALTPVCAVLHPAMRELVAARQLTPIRPTWWRIGLLTVAAFAGPAVLAVHAARGRHVDVPVILGVSLALFLLVALRMADLVRGVSRAERRFRALVQDGADLIAVIETNGTFRYASPSFLSVLGRDPSNLIDTDGRDLVHPDDRAAIDRVFARLTAAPNEQAVFEARLRGRDGGHRLFEAIAVNRCANPDIGGIVVNARDVTERKQLEERIQHQALHDALTDLPNRVLLADRLQHAVARSARGFSQIAVLMIDLDNFKLVNDSLGHQAGDDLLVTVARRLTSTLRVGDTVARLGGDEFVILLEALPDPYYAEEVAARLLAALAVPAAVAGHELAPSASIGIAVAVAATASGEELLRHADVAMYEAKRNGRAGYARYDAGMESRGWSRLQREAELRRAIAGDDLEVHYQPLVDLATGLVLGVEALVRWAHPERGLIPPADFIPLAEETGLIVPLGRWVLREACRQVRAWDVRREDGRPFTLAINLSARQFRDPALVDDVAAALRESGVAPAQLRLEITESVAMEDLDRSTATMKRLKALGVGLEIDDFGTGYSGLGSLKRCPVDTLKIDRAFVAGLGQDPSDTAIVRTVIALARLVGLDVTAEGIETARQVEVLRDLGCERGQGYLFARPLPADELETLLQTAPLGAELAFGGRARAVA